MNIVTPQILSDFLPHQHFASIIVCHPVPPLYLVVVRPTHVAEVDALPNCKRAPIALGSSILYFKESKRILSIKVFVIF